MDLGLSGKRALITGASAGLGFAVAQELAREGAQVVICGRTEATVKAAEEKLGLTGQKICGVTADISTPEGIDHVLTMADAVMGGVDILCMSTGGPPAGNFKDLNPEDFTTSANDLIESLVRLVKGVLPTMCAQNWGRVMAVTSVSAKQPLDNLILSNTIRAGILGLMKSLAQEYGPEGITFNALLPGFTQTARMEQVLKATAAGQGISYEQACDNAAAFIPMRRLGQPEEFAAMAAFLASERAGYVTGCAIPIDGGLIKGV